MANVCHIKPRVSVVMAAYNDAARVGRAVEGILRQSWTDWELIAINDGSTDQTGAILREVVGSDPRVRIIDQENAGLTAALVRGCSEAKGTYIARQDADDWSHANRLEEQVELLDSDLRIGFVSCATQYVGPNNEPLQVLTRPTDSQVATHGLLQDRQGPPAHGSVMFRKSLYEQVGGYRPEFYFGQDSDLWLRMAESDRIGYLASVRYFALREAESVSGAQRTAQQQFGRLAHDCRAARMRCESEVPTLAQAGALREEVLKRRRLRNDSTKDQTNATYLLGSQLTLNRDPRAASYLWRVLRSRPWHWKAWVRLVQNKLTAGDVPEVHYE